MHHILSAGGWHASECTTYLTWQGTQELHHSSGIEEEEEEDFYLLMPVFQDRSETRQQILDGGRHLGHTNDIHNGLEGTQDGSQHFRVLLSQVLIQDNTQVAQQFLLIASLHDIAEHEWRAAQESQRGYTTGHQRAQQQGVHVQRDLLCQESQCSYLTGYQ